MNAPGDPASVQSLKYSGRVSPTSAILDGFEYCLRTPAGDSNPVLLTAYICLGAAWAQQQTGYNPGQSAAAGAGIGAAIGALGGAAAGAAIGAITGNAGTGAAVGAVAGGVGGGAIGGTHQYQTSRQGYDKAFAACMGGRGYSVSR